MTKTDDWRAARLIFLRGLKKPTDAQRLLLTLHDLPDRDTIQATQLERLWKLDRIEARAEVARAEGYRIVKGKSMSARKERDHRLIQLGILVDIAAMGEDRGVILGALLHLSDQLRSKNSEVLAKQFKARGDAELHRRDVATKKIQSKIPAIQDAFDEDVVIAKKVR